MSRDLYLIEIENTLDEWSNGALSLEDAHDKLVRLGHAPDESQDMLRTHDPDRFRRQDEIYNAEIAGVIAA